jgi:hypothetical protein
MDCLIRAVVGRLRAAAGCRHAAVDSRVRGYGAWLSLMQPDQAANGAGCDAPFVVDCEPGAANEMIISPNKRPPSGGRYP